MVLIYTNSRKEFPINQQEINLPQQVLVKQFKKLPLRLLRRFASSQRRYWRFFSRTLIIVINQSRNVTMNLFQGLLKTCNTKLKEILIRVQNDNYPFSKVSIINR